MDHDFSEKCWGGRVVTCEAINAGECRCLLCGAVNRSFQTVLIALSVMRTFHIQRLLCGAVSRSFQTVLKHMKAK